MHFPCQALRPLLMLDWAEALKEKWLDIQELFSLKSKKLM